MAISSHVNHVESVSKRGQLLEPGDVPEELIRTAPLRARRDLTLGE